MKVPIYTIYIITLLIIGPSTVARGSVIDLEDEEKSSERLQFGTETNNLTQNQNDSVYPQIAAWKNNVYVVWSESTQGSTDKNYDIYFKASSDGGKTFGRTINLSDNPSFSEHPQIVAVENNVYVVWTDNTSGHKEVLFRMSTNQGTAFGKAIPISDENAIAYHPEITASGTNVFVIWNNLDGNNGNHILLRHSIDAGSIFDSKMEIGVGVRDSFPKVAADDNNFFVVWDVNGHDNNTKVMYKNGQDNNASLDDKTVDLNQGKNGGESQILSKGNNIFVSWTSNSGMEGNELSLVKSDDFGISFGNIVKVSNGFKSSNVETVMVDNNLFVVWQESVHDAEEILLKKSTDRGITFSQTVDLSNNDGISECPSIAATEGKLHIVWQDNTAGNNEVFYKQIPAEA
ncbi:MAG TPA: sialidase family protein [Nitrososphaeraceae archaeon]|jgi:hypothetical protein|nr:sialidase family protein [Nitrososphaeraceae archaeon]